MSEIRPHPDSVFDPTWLRFNANLGALWVFSREIAALADRSDRERVHAMALEFAPIFDDDPTEIESGLNEARLRRAAGVAQTYYLRESFFLPALRIIANKLGKIS